MNYVLEGDAIRSVAVEILNSTEGQYEAYERAVVWPDNSPLVPLDCVPGDAACWALHFISVCISI